MKKLADVRTNKIHEEQNLEKLSATGAAVTTVIPPPSDVDSLPSLLVAANLVAKSNIALDNTTTDVDGVTLEDGMLVLVVAQIDPAENGLYSASTSSAWTPVTPEGGWSPEMIVRITQGVKEHDSLWMVQNDEIVDGDTELSLRRYTQMFEDDQGRAGFGTDSPKVQIHAASDGSMLLEGDFGSGDDWQSRNAGSQMQFNARTGASRIGRVYDTKWNAENVGDESHVIGTDSMASGAGAQIFGSNSTASGILSYVLGNFSSATATNSYVLGDTCSASGSPSVAIGRYVRVTGNDSLIIGTGAGSTSITNANDGQMWLVVAGQGDRPSLVIDTSDATSAGNVGIHDTNPASTLHVKGSFGTTVVRHVLTAHWDLPDDAHFVVFYGGGIALREVTLPAVASCPGREVVLRNRTDVGYFIQAQPGETIDGVGSVGLGGQEVIRLKNDGTEWVTW